MDRPTDGHTDVHSSYRVVLFWKDNVYKILTDIVCQLPNQIETHGSAQVRGKIPKKLKLQHL